MPKLLPDTNGREYYSPGKVRKYVDKNIQDLIIKFNQLPYVQTTYSCGGHYYPDKGLVVCPCIDFFCDVNRRVVGKQEQKQAKKFLKRFKDVILDYIRNIPRIIIEDKKSWYANEEDSIVEQKEARLYARDIIVPFFRCNKLGGCSYNGSFAENLWFSLDNKGITAAQTLRQWHINMLIDLESIVVNAEDIQ